MEAADFRQQAVALGPQVLACRRVALMVALLLGAAGCRLAARSPDDALRHSPGETMVRTELLLGLSRPDGPDVTEAEFRSFLDAEVTPRFPDGYTVLHAEGRWRGQSQRTLRESSRVLLILRPPDPETNGRIEAIRDAYRSRFGQEAVLRVDAPAKDAF